MEFYEDLRRRGILVRALASASIEGNASASRTLARIEGKTPAEALRIIYEEHPYLNEKRPEA